DKEDNHIIPQRRPFDNITSESELDNSINEEEDDSDDSDYIYEE
ncbi:hypothetical protein INT45_006541, partial [Circinella minor]